MKCLKCGCRAIHIGGHHYVGTECFHFGCGWRVVRLMDTMETHLVVWKERGQKERRYHPSGHWLVCGEKEAVMGLV